MNSFGPQLCSSLLSLSEAGCLPFCSSGVSAMLISWRNSIDNIPEITSTNRAREWKTVILWGISSLEDFLGWPRTRRGDKRQRIHHDASTLVDAAMIVPYNLIALSPSMEVAKRRLIPPISFQNPRTIVFYFRAFRAFRGKSVCRIAGCNKLCA